MLRVDPDDQIAVIILHGSDIDRGAVIGVDGQPPRPVMASWLEAPVAVPCQAPTGHESHSKRSAALGWLMVLVYLLSLRPRRRMTILLPRTLTTIVGSCRMLGVSTRRMEKLVDTLTRK